MTDTTPYLALIDDRSTAFREAVSDAPDLAAKVPGCPDWTLRDLVVHLGEVHRFWAVVVTDADPSGPPSAERRGPRGPSGGDLMEWSAESTRLLLTALGDADPQATCWTWWSHSGAPQTVAAIARHQVQETAVHAYDAQEAIDRPAPIPAEIAVDGVEEFLAVPLASRGPWPHRPARLVFAATEGPSWTVDLTPTGVELSPAASGAPVATVRGSASDLVLVLHGRVRYEELRVDGDREALAELRAWAPAD